MNRRDFLGAVAAASTVAVAGCGGEREYSVLKEIEYDCKVGSDLRVGESLGARYGSEQWRVDLVTLRSDGSIDIRVTKTLLDGEGQDREGIDGEHTFERTRVEPGDQETIEDDLRVWYAERDGDEALIAVGREYCGDGEI